MAIGFSGIINTFCLTSQLGDIRISCGTHDSAYVEMINPGGNVVLAERFYAASGWITLRGLGELCESALRDRGISYGEFELSATAGGEQATAVLKLLYCDRFTPFTDCSEFFSENFLTTHSLRRIAHGADVTLSLLAKAGESIAWHIAIPLRDKATGEIRVATSAHAAAPTGSAAVRFVNIYWQTLVNAVKTQYPTLDGDIEQFTVYCGKRSATFFVDPSLRLGDTFLFRNCFNVQEELSVPMLTTSKTTVEQSLAVVNGHTRHYNRRPSQTFEVECGPLTAHEAEWLGQLVTSHEVVRVEPYSLSDQTEENAAVPVLITDFTCEVSESDEKPNTLKFTWRYADNRPLVRLSAPTNCFTEQYTPTFS